MITKNLEIAEDAEFVVVGAGPAGTAAAIELAREGRDVLLIDQHQFPRDKPCGDALWSSAVRALLDLELDDLIAGAEPIEGTRLVSSTSGRQVIQKVRNSDGRPSPRCLPRVRVDAEMVDSAIQRGARFLQGRACHLIENEGVTNGLIIRGENGEWREIRGRNFIAADGATSRLRKLAGVGQAAFGLRAFAMRQYFETEHPVDPLFEVRIPLQFRGIRLPGYGWIFPVSERLVNIGVGFYTSPKTFRTSGVSVLAVMRDFVEELQSDPRTTFGHLQKYSELRGAPVAIGFSAESVKSGNILFVGDAARMTDPNVGEGIASALLSGRDAALELMGNQKHRDQQGFETHLRRAFPRLGQDMGLAIRSVERFTTELWPDHSDGTSIPRSRFLNCLATAYMRGADDETSILSTPVYRISDAASTGVAKSLVSMSNLALDTLHTDFPMAMESSHRFLHANIGPSVACLFLSVESASGMEPTERSAPSALSLELFNLTVRILSQLSDKSSASSMNLGNGLATLIADHAMSQGLKLALVLGPTEAASLARTSRTVFEGAAIDADDAWRLDRTVERYFMAAGDSDGGLHEHAAGLGARMAGKPETEPALAEYGRNLGIALRVSNDVVALLDGDYPTAREPGEDLRYGNFTLPVIYALDDDPTLEQILTPETIECAIDQAVEQIRNTNAVERCLADCNRHADAALAALDHIDLKDTALRALIGLAVDRCAAQVAKADDDI